MKFLFAQPAKQRFAWELKTAVLSLEEQGVAKSDIVILFAKEDTETVEMFKEYDVHVYEDNRYDDSYIPSIRPYLWWQYLSEDSDREKNTFVYLDSDVVVTDISVFKVAVNSARWYCSDTTGYINRDYILGTTNGQSVLDVMENTLSMSDEWLQSENKNSGGAQWVIKNPKAGYWRDVFINSNELYHAIKPLDTNLQKWTAEMWAQLWTMYHYGIKPMVSPKLDFDWSTDKLPSKHGIIHNAGVEDENSDLFFKGKYLSTPPLEELSQNTGKVSDLYVDWVRRANYGR